MKKYIVMDGGNDCRYSHKVNTCVVVNTFYYMMLSTGKTETSYDKLNYNTKIVVIVKQNVVLLKTRVVLIQIHLKGKPSSLWWSKCQLSLHMRNPTFWVSDQSITKQAVQPQKQARSLKFQI